MATREQVENTKQTVEGLCRLAKQLGYRDPCSQLMNRDGSCVGDLLYFFEDNPGAIAAVLEWVLENHDLKEELDVPRCPGCGGSRVIPSEDSEYDFYCKACDDNFDSDEIVG